ncbi:MAG: hypothetical protein JO348_08600 [Alphaproteobacteria bacterium]|nr:hypothetical protein [Alphaproteobacteria bacterium]MBV9419819.1 hypothetical protein [Alphaproteobacteria bacterium]MBV9541673.1 hypothetical protein [Alphaproteobacteria bacterium]MBV9904412.1 hypothetical protein [Alphaproteobacteria bacterium]
MCEQPICNHEDHGLSRRGFAALTLGSMVALPFTARASSKGVTSLALSCIDYRLADDADRFFDSLKMTNDYDQISLAGASLAAVSDKFPSSNAAFWDHVNIAKQLHHIKKVVVLDHRDCGAYKVAFGDKFAGVGSAEAAQHKDVMLKMQATLKQKHPDLASEFYLMALDGSAARIL